MSSCCLYIIFTSTYSVYFCFICYFFLSLCSKVAILKMEFEHFKSENPVWNYFFVQEMAKRQNVKPGKLPFLAKEDPQEPWETTCTWSTRFRLIQRIPKQKPFPWCHQPALVGQAGLATSSNSLMRITAELRAVDRISFFTIATGKQMRGKHFQSEDTSYQKESKMSGILW